MDPFEKQPAELRRVLAKSFQDPARWFAKLDPESRIALAAIFSRLCAFQLWCHVRTVLKVAPGEAPVVLADRIFSVPGNTPSVFFLSRGGDALIQALMATGRFCMARGAGASQHPGQTTLRQISGSDSMHVSVGPGDQFDAHIDKFSPAPEHSGSSFCSNDPTVAALTHIGRELVPGIVRRKTGIPGVQVFPEPPTAPRPDVPPPPGSPSPVIVGVTVRGPRKGPQVRTRPDAGPQLPLDAVTSIHRAIRQSIRPDALVPARVRAKLAKARWAAETAGPYEETALRAARDAAEAEATSYPDPELFALGLAERLDQARRSRLAFVRVELPQYGTPDAASRKPIAAEIGRIANIVRAFLPQQAAGVGAIVIIFGTGGSAAREEVKLP